MASPLDAAKAIRSHGDQLALVEAVSSAPASRQETVWLEWKARLDLASRATRATIAKAVLGFANRDPDLAGRYAGGCAYLLGGVEPGDMPGVEHLDVAQLEAKVATYVGREVDWHASYVECAGVTVLVVTVEPPQWGDPLHPVRHTYNPSGPGPKFQEGAVFVRRQASTDVATAADVDMLSRRAARRPGDELAIDVVVAGATRVERMDATWAAREAYLDSRERMLLSTLQLPPVGPARGISIGSVFAAAGEYRSKEDFQTEVEEYIGRLREALPEALSAKARDRNMGPLQLSVSNPTDTPFMGVQVDVRIPDSVLVLTEDDPPDRELPESPTPYGSARRIDPLGLTRVRPSIFESPIVHTLAAPEVQRRDDAVHVRFEAVTVRPRGETELDLVWLLASQDAPPGSISAEWEATATNARGRVTGRVDIPVMDDSLWSPEDLLADPDDSQD